MKTRAAGSSGTAATIADGAVWMTRGRFVVGARWLGMLRRSGKGASRAIWIADDASDKRYCTGHTTAERFNSPTLGAMSDVP
jgi:hypothetical protein